MGCSQGTPTDSHTAQNEFLIQKLRNPWKGGRIQIDYLHIKSIPYFPKGGVIHLNLTALRNVSSLPTLPRYLQTLSITNLKALTILPGLPDTLYSLTLIDTPIERLPTLPEWLHRLTVIGTNLTGLNDLPPHMQFLTCAQNRHLKTLGPLPPTLLELNCCSSPLEALPPLPDSLLQLNCELTQIKTLPALPPNLKGIKASASMLEVLPPLPPELVVLEVHETPLQELPRLPFYLQVLYCHHTRITRFPHMLPERLRTLNCDTDFFADLYEVPIHLEHLMVYDYKDSDWPLTSSYTELTEFVESVNLKRAKQRFTNRCLTIKEELIAEVWKPSRVAALIEKDRWDVME
jgi:hypothetical protein